MQKTYRQGAIGALLDEYERAIIDLQQVISHVSNTQLTTIADHTTTDPDCVSIQTVLHHVVNSGFGYATYIQKLKNPDVIRPKTNLRPSTTDYYNDLNQMFAFTLDTFANMSDEEAEKSEKIHSPWGIIYDIEQLMEHAIVHILRHRRQIEKFIIHLSK